MKHNMEVVRWFSLINLGIWLVAWELASELSQNALTTAEARETSQPHCNLLPGAQKVPFLLLSFESCNKHTAAGTEAAFISPFELQY